tara:strand:- start:166 stop:471 length:306 start_codon:yes stop_codon:yes gene_type:complete
MYKITEHTKNRLNDLNKKLNTDKINIDLSTNKNKKLDIFIQNDKVGSIGSLGSSDYGTYITSHGKDYAESRKKLYYQRHKNEKDIKDGEVTNSWFAKYFLW